MKLYLVQHGEATSEEENPERPLTAKGRSDMERIAYFVGRLGLQVDRILHSTKTRAQQTAEILATSLSFQVSIIQSEGLAPNDPIEPFIEKLKSMESNLMVVGHLPFLSKLASALLIDNPSRQIIAFKPGGIVCLLQNGTWQIEWILTPDLVK